MNNLLNTLLEEKEKLDKLYQMAEHPHLPAENASRPLCFPLVYKCFSMCSMIPRQQAGCKPFGSVFVHFVRLHSAQPLKANIFCASTTVSRTKTNHPNRFAVGVVFYKGFPRGGSCHRR